MLLHWIWFAELENITLMQKHKLLEQFHDPEELYHTAEEALIQSNVPDNVRQVLQ